MPELSNVPPPESALSEQQGVAPLALTPAQQVFFYDPDRWEELIREWATTLQSGYSQIKRIGGTNDKGADVAAFLSELGFEGEWDCFQCKHYAQPLAWSDVLPELVKVFRYAAAGEYTVPRRYLFLAPRGLSATMNRLISKPSSLKSKFLKDAPEKLRALQLEDDEIAKIVALANSDSFSRFSSDELADVLEAHRGTPYFSERFGAPLPPRTQHGQPPAQVDVEEASYINHLLDVYAERWGEQFDSQTVNDDERTQKHFQRQRVRFFEAESLKSYARDSVPPGTFARFQDAILSGVEDVLDADHPDGWARLTSTLAAAGQLNLASYALVAVAAQDDIKGVCHQLANDERLKWVRP